MPRQVERRCSVQEAQTALHKAALSGHSPVVQLLLNAKATMSKADQARAAALCTISCIALHRCILLHICILFRSGIVLLVALCSTAAFCSTAQ